VILCLDVEFTILELLTVTSAASVLSAELRGLEQTWVAGFRGSWLYQPLYVNLTDEKRRE
jgi:hypothetical protein